jgi:hypothetical protein
MLVRAKLPLRVVLVVGDVEVVAYAEDWKAALVEAFNLLEMQTELPPGWTLRVEEDGNLIGDHFAQ